MKMNDIKFLPKSNAVAKVIGDATGIPFVGEMMVAAAGNGGDNLELNSVTIKVEADVETGDPMIIAYAKFNKELGLTDTGTFNFAYNEPADSGKKGLAQYYGNFTLLEVNGDTATYIAESEVYVDKYNSTINYDEYDVVTWELTIDQDGGTYIFDDFMFTYQTFTISNVVITKVADAVEGVSDAEYTVTADSDVDMTGYNTIYLYSTTTGVEPETVFDITLICDENDSTKMVLDTDGRNTFNEELITSEGGTYTVTNDINDYAGNGNWTYDENINNEEL